MKYFIGFILVVITILYLISSVWSEHYYRKERATLYNNEKTLRGFLCGEYEKEATDMCTKSVVSEWNHLVDIKDKHKEEISVNFTLQSAKFDKFAWHTYFKDVDITKLKDTNLKRQITKLSNLGHSALDDHKLAELSMVLNNMTAIYGTAKICPYTKPSCSLKKEGITLEKDIDEIMAKSTDYDELLYTWITWRDATGPKIKHYYEMYVDLSNAAARANNFTDKGEMWRNEFEIPFFEQSIMDLWNEISPLYSALHTYVYNKLRSVYRVELVDDEDDMMIPAHLLGNMWGQTWTNLAHLVKPFPHESKIDVTAEMKKHNYTALKMFQVADDFYKSLGMPSSEMSYDVKKGAMIERPKDRECLCHASAWDFCDGTDFRIKMCTQVNFQDFMIIHHEMGHIQYYLQYKHLPIVYRSGANPGFHEAIGDTIALSVSTPRHLKQIGLLDQCYKDTYEADINALMDMALERVAFLPFGLVIDKWRWDIFAEKVDPSEWNSHWWRYRENIQKVKAPVPRSDEMDFDPGAKFHVAADSQYISYFFAHILEFQIYKSLCKTSGQYQPEDKRFPLHKCDFYHSKSAGQKLMTGLKLGASKHWTYTLQKMTGTKKLTGEALLEYFNPLYKFLVRENSK